jgi:hypothetical protein
VASSPVVGGHSIITGGYGAEPAETDPDAALGGDEKFITWADETSFTDEFWANGVEECWIVIWPEHLGSKEFLAGLDVAGLATAYTEITGKPFPVTVPPSPGPAPAPPLPNPPGPSPVPIPDPAGLLAELVALIRTDSDAVIAWLEDHSL